MHGFLVRNGLEGEYRTNIEANHATLAGHSFHHEVAFAAANGMLGSIDANRGDPQNGWDTDQFPNSVEDLALPLYEILRAGGIAPGGFNFDAKLRRQSTAPHRPVPRPHRRPRHARPRPARRGRPRRARASSPRSRTGATPAGTASSGTAILGGSLSLADLEARVADGAHRPGARLGQPGAPREPRQPADLGGRPGRTGPDRWASSSGSTSPRPRPRRSSSTPSGAVLAIGTSAYGFDQPHPLWSEQDPHLWWTGAIDGDRRARWRPAASSAERRRGASGSPGRCTASCCSTPRARSCGRRSCGTTSARPPSATRSARPSARQRLVEITGNDALTGFTAPKLAWVRAHEPEIWARVAHVLLPKDYVRYRLTGGYALDKADGAGTQLFDLAARDWSPVMLEALGHRPGVDAADARGPGGDRRRVRDGAAAATGLRAGTPVMAGGGDQAANAVGVGAVVARHGGAVAGHVGRGVRDDRPARCSSPRAGSTRSATPCRAAGT